MSLGCRGGGTCRQDFGRIGYGSAVLASVSPALDGMVSEEEVAAMEEEFPQDPPSFVQPCHPDSQVGNWRVISQSEVYTADSM